MWLLDGENRERRENRTYLKMDFIVPMCALGVVWIVVTGVLLLK